MTWHSFLLIGRNGRTRDEVERGLLQRFSATRIVVADEVDTAIALLAGSTVDCLIVVAPPGDDQRTDSICSALMQAKPELHGVPFVVFNGAKGWQRSHGLARVYF